MELNLTASNRNEELVLEHLKNTVTDILAEKINTGKKTLAGCWNFIVGEAKKKAEMSSSMSPSGSVSHSGCVAIEAQEVFGWAVHYFEEDSIEECKSAPAVKTTTTAKPKAEKKPIPVTDAKAEPPKAPKSKKVDEAQLSMFDLFG